MQGMRRITDQLDPVPQFFADLRTGMGESDDCTSGANNLHR